MRAGAQALIFEGELTDGRNVVIRLARPGVALASDGVDLTGLSHPSLARVFEIGNSGGADYQILEHIDGDTLADRIRARATFSPNDVRTFVEQVSDALEHLAPLVHADLSPANIMVRRESLRFVLIDYGLTYRSEHTIMNGVEGRTPRYTPPEGFLGYRSRKWDWWSLGMLVAELLTGRHPLGDADQQTAAFAVVYGWFDVSPVVDPRWSMLVAGLLTADVEHRWTGAQVRDWLAGVSPPVVGSPATVGPPKPPPLRFANHEFRADPRRLADALGSNWAEAARVLGSPEARTTVAAWARQFNDADLMAAIEPSRGASLDQQLVRVIGALYSLPRQGRPGACRNWYRGTQLTPGALRSLCADALASAQDLAETSADPEELDRLDVSAPLRLVAHLVQGDLAVLAEGGGPGGGLSRLSAQLEAGREYIRSATEDLDPPREDWEELLWAIHLLACLVGPGAAAALRRDAERVARLHRELRPLVGAHSSSAHHLVATVRSRRTHRRRLWV
jgi:hypothetical protein